MKNSATKDWLIDGVVILALAGVSVFVLPMVSACCATLSLHVGRRPLLLVLMALDNLLPSILVGAALGIIAAALLRHRRLALALLPAVFLCLFYVSYDFFGPYPLGRSWFDIVFVGSRLLLVAASLLCARVVLRRRQPNKASEPTSLRSEVQR